MVRYFECIEQDFNFFRGSRVKYSHCVDEVRFSDVYNPEQSANSKPVHHLNIRLNWNSFSLQHLCTVLTHPSSASILVSDVNGVLKTLWEIPSIAPPLINEAAGDLFSKCKIFCRCPDFHVLHLVSVAQGTLNYCFFLLCVRKHISFTCKRSKINMQIQS